MLAIEKYILSRVIPAFANTFMFNNLISQSIPTGTTWTKLDLINPEFSAKHFELDLVNKRLVAKKKGNYLATLSFPTISTSNITLETASFKNDEELHNVHIHRQLTGTSIYSSASTSGIITLNKGDYVDVRIRHNSGNAVNVTARYASMLLVKI